MDKEISNLDPNPSLLKDTDETIINKKNAGSGFTTVRDSLYNFALYVISKIIPSSGYVKSNGTSLTSTSAIPAADITQDSTHKFVTETTRYNLEDNANNQDGYLKASTDAPTGILNAPAFNNYMSMPNVSNQRLWYDVTLGEAMTANELVCYIGDDRKLYKASTSDPSKLQHQLGLRLASANGLNDPNMFITYGYITLDYTLITGYTAGYNGAVWLTSTGALTITKPGSNVVYIGTATRFSGGQVELFVNPEYRDVSTGGGGGISEPTTDGNWLRSKVSSTYIWVEGVLKSTYDSFVSSVNATFAWTKSAGVQSGTTLDWGSTDISTITGTGSVTINSISNLTDGVRNYIITGYSSFGFNTSLIPASSILGNYIAGQTNKLQIINLKDGEFQLTWSNITMAGGGSTNLTYTASPTNGVVNSDTGTDATIPVVDVTNAGLVTPTMKSTWDAKQNIPTDENITTSGTINLDFATQSGFDSITQTGSITFTASNTTGAKKTTKTIVIQGSGNSTHTFTIPSGWVNLSGVMPDYSKLNYIEVTCVEGTVFFCVNKYSAVSTTTPVLVTATILQDFLNVIELKYDRLLDASIALGTWWFSITGKTTSMVSIVNNTVRITVSSPFATTDTAVVTFTNTAGTTDGLQDAVGNKCPNFTAQNVILIRYAYDDFNRADSSTSVGTASDGTPWQVINGTWGISGNKMYAVSAVNTGAATVPIIVKTAAVDCSMKYTITWPTSTQVSNMSTIFRYQDANNYMLLQFARRGDTKQVTAAIYKVISGVTTQIGSPVNVTLQADGTSNTFITRVRGYQITMMFNNTVYRSETDQILPQGDKVGFRLYDGAGCVGNLDRIDDVVIGE